VFSARIREIAVFMIAAVTLAAAVRRSNDLLIRRAAETGADVVASNDLVTRAEAELGGADVAFRPLIAQAPQPIRGLEHPIAIWEIIERGDR
jgi:hypothetical protein